MATAEWAKGVVLSRNRRRRITRWCSFGPRPLCRIKSSPRCLSGDFWGRRMGLWPGLIISESKEHLFAVAPSVGFLMGCATCGLWNPFTDAPKRKSPLPSPRTPADSLRTRVRPSRFANRTGAEKARRLCRPEQEYAMPPVPFDGPWSRDCHRAGPTDTPDCSPAHLAFGRSTWCPLTVRQLGRPADPRRPTSWARDNRRSACSGLARGSMFGADVRAHAP